MAWRRFSSMILVATIAAGCSDGGGPLARPPADESTTAPATDQSDRSDRGLPDECGQKVEGPGLSRAGTPGPIVYQEDDGEGLVVVGPDGKERGRIAAPRLSHGYAVGTNKALYMKELGGLVLVDAEQLTATSVAGPVNELTSSVFTSGGGRRFLPVTKFAAQAAEIVDLDTATATDVADIIGGGGSAVGVHLDDAEHEVAVFTGHGVWVTDTGFLEDATQLDARAEGRGDISADGCAVAYLRGDADSGSLDVSVADAGSGEPGATVGSVTVEAFGLPDLQWVGRRLILCDPDAGGGGSGAVLIDPRDGTVEPFGTGRCTDVVRDVHRSEAIVNVGDTVDTHWFHVGADGAPEPLDQLAGYNATAVTFADLVPLTRDFGEPQLVYSFADDAITPTDPLPAAESGATDDLVPGSVIKVQTLFDGTTRRALAIDLRDGRVHEVASGGAETPIGLPAPAPDGSAVVTVVGISLAITRVAVREGQATPIGTGSIPVWTVAEFAGGAGSGSRP